MKRSLTFIIFAILFFGAAAHAPDTTAVISSNDGNSLSLNAVQVDGIIGSDEYEYSHTFRMRMMSYMKMYYTIVRSTIYIGLEMSATGWVAIGWGGTGDMDNYDIMTGGYDASANRAYIFDCYSIGKVVPPVDGVQNYIEYAATESSGYTYFEFSRELNTGDTQGDKPIIPGQSTNVIAAMHGTSDDISIEHTRADDTRGFVFYGPPAAPENLMASTTRTQVSLDWIAPPGDGGFAISNYVVYRSDDGGQTYTQIATTTQTSFVDNTVVTGVIYQYKVTAVNSKGESGDSNVVIALPLGDITPPQSVTATPGSFQVDLSWDYPADDGGIPVIAYNIYRAETQGGPYSFIGTNTSALGYQDADVINGFTYYYVVTALNKYNESAYSTEVMATPVGEPTPPLNIHIINGDNSATLNWTEPLSDGGFPITQYNVYRSQTQGGPYTFIGSNDSTTGYYDPTAVNGETYYYVVTAVNTFGESAFSEEQRILIANAPLAPTNLNGTFGDGIVMLTWDPADGRGFEIMNYTIYRKGPNDASFTAIATVNTTNYTDTGLTNGVTYRYVITATSAVGESPYSDILTITPATVPSSPTGLSAKVSNDKVQLSWEKPAENGGFPILYYNVYRSVNNEDNFILYDFTYSKTYLDADITAGDTYYYKVTAVNNVGESDFSNVATISPAEAPDAPTGLKATFENGSVTLAWNEPTSDGGNPISYYRVYRTSVKGGVYIKLATTENTTFVDMNVEVGMTYYYAVTAVNDAGESDYSPEASIQLVTPPATPTDVVALAAEDLVTVAWLPGTGPYSPASYFEVYRAVNDSKGEFTLVAEINTTYYIDYDVEINVTYYYYVVAVNEYGKSSASDIVEATPGQATVSIPADLLQQNVQDVAGSQYPEELNQDVIEGTAAIFGVLSSLGAVLWVLKKIFFMK